MRRIKEAAPGVLALVVLVVLVVLGVVYELGLWSECRSAGHSIGYCLRVLDKP